MFLQNFRCFDVNRNVNEIYISNLFQNFYNTAYSAMHNKDPNFLLYQRANEAVICLITRGIILFVLFVCAHKCLVR